MVKNIFNVVYVCYNKIYNEYLTSDNIEKILLNNDSNIKLISCKQI